MSSERNIYIVGTGVDGKNTLTLEAKNIISGASFFAGAKRVLESVKELINECENPIVLESYHGDEIAEWILNNSDMTSDAVILMSGDACFFSGAAKVLEAFEKRNIKNVKIINGISSVVYFAGRINKTWQDMNFVSLHGADANIVREVVENEKTIFLLGGKYSAGQVCERLEKYGKEDVDIILGENLGLENESVKKGRISDFINYESGPLALLYVENPEFEKEKRIGISDTEFIRGSVPMTKAEVRAVVMSKLSVGKDDICWDMGCGTGSVSVEMAIQALKGKVYSVDKNKEAVKLTKANVVKFSCDNIEVIESDIENSLDCFPAPDKVFIGGGSEKIRDIVKCARMKNDNCKFVITAVSLETLGTITEVFDEQGMEADFVQVAVTKVNKIGSHRMLQGENPIFICSSR